MEWFRVYHAVLHDPKIQRLPVDLRWHWLSVLCAASEASDRGIVPPNEDLSFMVRAKPDKCARMTEQLVEAGLIDRLDDGRLEPHNWHLRQPRSDDSAERQRTRRSRDNAEDVTDVSRDSHALDKSREEKNREEEIRSEEDVPAALVFFDGHLQGLSGYKPSPAFYEKLIERYPGMDFGAEALKIREWVQRKNAKCSVTRVFNWLDNAQANRRNEGGKAQQSSGSSPYADAFRRRAAESAAEADAS